MEVSIEEHNNITYYLRKFNVIYGGQGIKCPYCASYFSSSYDLKTHLETHWIETRRKSGWILDASLDPVLAARISNAGTLVEGIYKYVILGAGKNKKIYRSRATNRY
jgi:hypothetical protein